MTDDTDYRPETVRILGIALGHELGHTFSQLGDLDSTVPGPSTLRMSRNILTHLISLGYDLAPIDTLPPHKEQ